MAVRATGGCGATAGAEWVLMEWWSGNQVELRPNRTDAGRSITSLAHQSPPGKLKVQYFLHLIPVAQTDCPI